MLELRASERFAATIGAQIGGLFLLLVIAIPFPASKTDIVKGKQWIEIAEVIIFLVLLLGMYLARRRSKKCNGIFDDSCVNITISTYIICDIPILLFLVCQQGGICRSILMPVFFLIPLAHREVEKREKWVKGVMGAIVLCIIFTFMVSLYVGDPSVSGVHSLPTPIRRLTITDFSSPAAHKGYDWAILIAAIISVMIPFIQRAFVSFVKTLFNGNDGNELSDNHQSEEKEAGNQ